VIGDPQVGKSNLMLRVCNKPFSKKPKTTYGVEFDEVTTNLPNSNQRVKTQVWDTSGAKQFISISTVHYRFSVGVFLIYDVTNKKSFENLGGWLEKIRTFCDEHVKIALVGNKKDLVDPKETDFQKVIDESGDES